MSDTPSGDASQNGWNSYQARYCENCGCLYDASVEIEDRVTEPVHRVDLIEAIGPIEEVSETVAVEERKCECTGQVVKRYYTYPAERVPEPDYEPEPEQYTGRDPEKDALLSMSDDPGGADWQEIREISWIETESDDEN